MNEQELVAAREAIINELIKTVQLLRGDAIINPYHLQEIAHDAGQLRIKVATATMI